MSLVTFVLYSCTNKEKESTTEKTEEQEVYQISEKTPKLVRTEAKTDDYETLQKLEEKSPIILLVQKKLNQSLVGMKMPRFQWEHYLL